MSELINQYEDKLKEIVIELNGGLIGEEDATLEMGAGAIHHNIRTIPSYLSPLPSDNELYKLMAIARLQAKFPDRDKFTDSEIDILITPELRSCVLTFKEHIPAYQTAKKRFVEEILKQHFSKTKQPVDWTDEQLENIAVRLLYTYSVKILRVLTYR